MRELLLTHNNHTFTVSVDEDSYLAITKDMNTLRAYAKLVYEQVFSSGSNKGSEEAKNRNSDDINDSINSLLTSRTPSNSFIVKNTDSFTESFRWNDKLIKCLLEIRLAKEPEFINPICKKAKLWRQIAEEISKVTGIHVTGEACDTKYRNLLCTYRINKKKQSSTGEGAIKWEYFQTFDEVLGCKASSIAPAVNIGDSVEDDTNESITSITDADSDSEVPGTSKRTNMKIDSMKKLKKRKCGMSFQTYLWEKNKRETEKEKYLKEKEEEKEKRAREMWEEKKNLKEKEIDAILTLAKAISEPKK